MRNITTVFAFIFAIFISLPSFAYTPNQGVTFREFVEARGCVLIDKGGYVTFKVGCPAAAEYTPVGSILVDADNNPSTPDVWVSDN